MMRITRRYRFSASHRLRAAGLSDSANEATYGKCANPHGHGHNYVLEVSAGGPVDPLTGQVLNPAGLDALVNRVVLRAFDHRNLNAEVAEFAGAPPTTENLARQVWRRLSESWPQAFPGGPRLVRVRLQETPRNSFEIMEGE